MPGLKYIIELGAELAPSATAAFGGVSAEIDQTKASIKELNGEQRELHPPDARGRRGHRRVPGAGATGRRGQPEIRGAERHPGPTGASAPDRQPGQPGQRPHLRRQHRGAGGLQRRHGADRQPRRSVLPRAPDRQPHHRSVGGIPADAAAAGAGHRAGPGLPGPGRGGHTIRRSRRRRNRAGHRGPGPAGLRCPAPWPSPTFPP